MPRWRPLPLVGGAYSDDSRPFSHQDTVNYLVERAERPGTRSSAKLRGAPGMVEFCDLGTNAPIRGMRNVEGRLLVVSGQTLFSIGTNGASRILGSIPGVARTKMSHNQITGGNEVAIPAGSSGYVYNTVTDTLTRISDEGFPGATTFDYCDSYLTGIEPLGRFAFHSNLAAATDYNTVDRYEAEGSPDKLIAQIVTHREWWLCGERTMEPYVNTGAATGTFQRQSGTVIERGVASPHCLSLLDNSVFWLGNDGVVYRANGYTPERISTMPIEQAIAQCNTALAFSFVFEDEGHKIFYLTLPDGHTWGFDVASSEWHRRESKGLNRWRLNDLVKWNGQWIGGDYSNGKLYTLHWGVQSDAGETLERRRTMGVVHDDGNAVIVNAVKLVVDTGRKPAVVNSPAHVLTIAGNITSGTVGDVVSTAYTSTATNRPVMFSVASGALPDGLTLASDGTVTGTLTVAGSFSWTVRATDGTGATKDLDDSAVIAEIMPAQLSDWRYLQIDADDATDYSASDFDDSAWAVGTAPFGGDTDDTVTGLAAATAYDPRFATEFATAWTVFTRLWLRRTLTLPVVPADDLLVTCYIEDHCTFYINGTSVITTPADHDGGVGQQFTISSDSLVAGDNIIAIQCDDEAPSSVSVVYADFIVEISA